MKITLAVLCIALLAATGCKKLDNLLSFNVDYADTTSVPVDPLVGFPFTFSSGNISTSSIVDFQAYNTSSNLIKHVYMKQLTLNILSPQGQSFNFLQSTEIYLYTSTLGATEVAYLDSIPAGSGSQLMLKMTNVDIQAYLKTDSFAIRTSVLTSQATTQQMTISSSSVYQVTASPF